MKNVEMVSKAIHEKIMTKPVVNWYRVTELETERVYEVKFYVNFFVDDENDMKMFERDVQELVKAIENNTLLKIEDKYFILIIDKVNIVEDGVLEITTICEKIQK